MYSHKPTVSIIIPLYCVEQYVAECIRSVLNQDYPALEVVVVDDDSPDRSAEIVSELFINENPLRHKLNMVKHPHNRGSAMARESGVQAAGGELLLFLDSDDYLITPSAVSLIVEKMLQEQADLLLYGWKELFRHSTRTSLPKHFSTSLALAIAIISGRAPGYLCNKCFRKDFFVQYARFFEGCDMWEDIVVTSICAYQAQRIAYLDTPLLMYRRTNENALTYRLTPKKLHSMQHQQGYLKEYFDKEALPQEQDALQEALHFMGLSILHTELSYSNYSRYKELLATHPPLQAYLRADGSLAARFSLMSIRLYNAGLRRLGYRVLRFKHYLLRLR